MKCPSSKAVLRYSLLLLCLNLFFLNCEKETVEQHPLENYQNPNLQRIEQTKAWFEGSKNKLNVLNVTQTIDWEHSIISHGYAGTVIEVPLILQDGIVTLFNNDDTLKSFHRLVFIEHAEGYKLFHLIITTGNKSFNNNAKDFNYYRLEEDFDGFTMVLDAKNELRSFHKYKAGVVLPKPKPSITGKETVYCTYYGEYTCGGFRVDCTFDPWFLVKCSALGDGEEEGYGSNHGGRGSGPVDSERDDDNVPPSCESFNFVSTSSNWQEAAVKNIRFKVVVLSPNGNYINFNILYTSPILFGSPKNILNGGNISSGLAAELSAKALKTSMDETVQHYGNKLTTELQVRLFFEERMKYNYSIITNGGRVNFNPMSLTITPTEYITNFFGIGNCD